MRSAREDNESTLTLFFPHLCFTDLQLICVSVNTEPFLSRSAFVRRDSVSQGRAQLYGEEALMDCTSH